MGALGKVIKIVFVGRQPRGLDKSAFAKFIRESRFLSAEVDVDSVSKVNIPSGHVVPDDYVFDFPAIDESAWCNLLVFQSPLEGNWFTRSNFGETHYDSRDSVVVALTTYEIDEFAEDAGISLEKALAANALRAIVAAEFIKSGGKFWELYSKYSDGDDAFAFCKDKTEIVDKLINGRLGFRSSKVLGATGYTDEMILNLDRDLAAFSRTFSDKLRLTLQRNRDVIISSIFFVLGVLTTLLFENFG